MPLTDILRYSYDWPRADLSDSPGWQAADQMLPYVSRPLPETAAELAADSRWPGFFPSPMCIVSAEADGETALEKVVGPSIVNRFPYIMALSFCREQLSARHHPRRRMMEILEAGGSVAVQFLPPGQVLDKVISAIVESDEAATSERLARTGLATRRAQTSAAPVFKDAYMVYEATLVTPRQDFEGVEIFPRAWEDVGSHRVYFLEVRVIQLRRDIAEGRSQIAWRALPSWAPVKDPGLIPVDEGNRFSGGYQKAYRADYKFPAAGTIAFEWDTEAGDMVIKTLPPDPRGQVQIDNDRARWPCFFPSSLGMITTWSEDGRPNLMPCGSTTIVSRHPLVVAVAICCHRINDRYAPRITRDTIHARGRFGCGVAYDDPAVIDAIRYTGNVSFADDPEKVANSGLGIVPLDGAPMLAALPVHFDCKVVGEVRLGTHSLIFGEVERVLARPDVSPLNPLRWLPWADVVAAS